MCRVVAWWLKHMPGLLVVVSAFMLEEFIAWWMFQCGGEGADIDSFHWRP